MPLLRPATALRALRSPSIAASTQQRPISSKAAALASPTNRLRNGLYGTLLLGLLGFGYIEATDTRSSIHTYTVPTLLRYIFSGDDVSRPGPEAAHVFGLRALNLAHALGVPLRERGDHPYLPHLRSELFGLDVNTPLGISAGLDKHADAIDALFELSPSIALLEVGCVTPKPQDGNERPRLFRLPISKSFINRYGFNSIGADAVARRLRERVRRYAREHGMTEEEVLNSLEIPASLRPGRILAVQIGKNKTTPETDIEAVKRDYVECVQKLGKYADVIVVNVSSPNTPGLRSLQAAKPLTELLGSVVKAAEQVERARKPKVVVKVSPDSDSRDQIRDICQAVKNAGLKGVIVANTTVTRPPELTASPQTSEEEKRIVAREAGGLSGPALLPRTLRLVREYRNQLGRDIEVIASGGVSSGKDAMDCVKQGASGVMGYTGMVYGGVGWFGRVAQELAEEAEKLRSRRR
ncbi:Dihydroorotate dehydrogenase-domain-containing protein [Sphaerosporella brunnea]|uniref:Dihydroorotate dehydrogenase (quinone), mitochondrial n=1 Tax=Sphaerosporella brunnea TaxID=1250544 RepID=A0A5J5EEG1_9PEZI|nr:Dihydroorotate dehydrogenase-domain-containing protein [Sphaerosporella brunnea]